jgi:hypothetical protein
MQQKQKGKLFVPLFILFAFVNLAFTVWAKKWQAINVNHEVVLVGNILLFALAVVTLAMHAKASKNKNPNVLVRSIMGAMLIKMMVMGITTVIYLVAAKQQRNVPGIGIVMGLYLIYLIIEVKVALQLNKKQSTDASN